MFAGSIFAYLALLAAFVAMLSFPVYYWIRGRRQKGRPVWGAGLLGAVIVGILGAAAILAFMLAKG